MVVILVTFLSLSAAAHARDGDSGHKKKRKKLPKHARVLQAQIIDNKESIENIELTPGPQGDKSDTGTTGATGPTGDKGDKGDTGANGLSIQGPKGDPGTSSWTDGFETVSTTGSVQIGNDTAVCTVAKERTIRFNTVTKMFEGCTGTAWESLNAFACGDQIQDSDGNFYFTVTIGNQCWMAENLNVGTIIASTIDQTDNGRLEKYCYDDNPANCNTYGSLYQWNEMMQYVSTEGAQGICPSSWHLPTDTEWKTMEAFLGMSQLEANLSNSFRGTTEGWKLRSTGTSRFEWLLAGFRNWSTGTFFVIGTGGYLWSSTESDTSSAWQRSIDLNRPTI